MLTYAFWVEVESEGEESSGTKSRSRITEACRRGIRALDRCLGRTDVDIVMIHIDKHLAQRTRRVWRLKDGEFVTSKYEV